MTDQQKGWGNHTLLRSFFWRESPMSLSVLQTKFCHKHAQEVTQKMTWHHVRSKLYVRSLAGQVLLFHRFFSTPPVPKTMSALIGCSSLLLATGHLSCLVSFGCLRGIGELSDCERWADLPLLWWLLSTIFLNWHQVENQGYNPVVLTRHGSCQMHQRLDLDGKVSWTISLIAIRFSANVHGPHSINPNMLVIPWFFIWPHLQVQFPTFSTHIINKANVKLISEFPAASAILSHVTHSISH